MNQYTIKSPCLLLVALLVLLIVGACNSPDNEPDDCIAGTCGPADDETGACGTHIASTSLIKGPTVGVDGNNWDNPFRALAIHPTDPAVIYVGSEGNGLFKSTDGGVNWIWLREGLLHCTAYPEIYSIAIDSGNPDRMLLATNSGPGPVDSGITSIAGVYKSTDGGTTWNQSNSALPNADTNSVLIISGSHFLVGLGAGQATNAGDVNFYPGGIYHAGFASTSWSATTAPKQISESMLWQILNKPSGLIAFAGNPTSGSGLGAGVIKSHDGGLTWISLAAPLAGTPGAHIEASDDLQILYATLQSGAGNPTFFMSTDGGLSWTNPLTLGSNYSGPVRIVGSNPNTVLATSSNTISRTVDGFASITTVLIALGDVMMIETAPSDSNVVYATTKGLHVYRSTDGGQNFTLQSSIRSFIDSH